MQPMTASLESWNSANGLVIPTSWFLTVCVIMKLPKQTIGEAVAEWPEALVWWENILFQNIQGFHLARAIFINNSTIWCVVKWPEKEVAYPPNWPILFTISKVWSSFEQTWPLRVSNIFYLKCNTLDHLCHLPPPKNFYELKLCPKI